jgi:hypothetical protein
MRTNVSSAPNCAAHHNMTLQRLAPTIALVSRKTRQLAERKKCIGSIGEDVCRQTCLRDYLLSLSCAKYFWGIFLHGRGGWLGGRERVHHVARATMETMTAADECMLCCSQLTW